MNFNTDLFHLSRFFFQANNDGGAGAGNNAGEQQQENNESDSQANFTTIEDWYKSLKPDVQKIAEPAKAHFERMQATVKATREERDQLQIDLRNAAKTLKEGSDERKSIEEMTSKLDEANRRADFMEDAPSMNCNNPKAAYAIAKTNNLFTRAGLPDWKAIQAEAPQLFTVKQRVTQRKTSGSGTNEQVPNNQSMNDWIRGQAR